jgi:hypothetical protein
MKTLCKIALSALALRVGGCVTSPPFYGVRIDSINVGEQRVNPAVILQSGNKTVDPTDLQFQEFAAYTIRALQSKGMLIVTNMNEADVEVFLYYAIGDPVEHQFSRSVPIFGKTVYSGSQTFGTVQSLGSSGAATYSGTTTYTPAYGIVGSAQQSGTYVTCTRYVALDAYDLHAYRDAQKEKQIWKTDIFSTGSSSDLRLVFPIMMAAAAEYIGSNTGHKVEVTLRETDPRVYAIKGQTPPPPPPNRQKRFNASLGRYE